MKNGTMVYDPVISRMDIRFTSGEYYGGLHCGTTMDVLIDGQWVPTRIEMSDDWYLLGVKASDLSGLGVRI